MFLRGTTAVQHALLHRLAEATSGQMIRYPIATSEFPSPLRCKPPNYDCGGADPRLLDLRDRRAAQWLRVGSLGCPERRRHVRAECIWRPGRISSAHSRPDSLIASSQLQQSVRPLSSEDNIFLLASSNCSICSGLFSSK